MILLYLKNIYSTDEISLENKVLAERLTGLHTDSESKVGSE